jgi:hypothetical protein
MAPAYDYIKTSLSVHPITSFFSFVFLSFVATILVAHFSTWQYPVEIPRLREPEGKRTFSLWTHLVYYTDAKELFRDAYEKVNTLLAFFGSCSNKNSTLSTARHVSSLVSDSATKSSFPQPLSAGLPPSPTIYSVALKQQLIWIPLIGAQVIANTSWIHGKDWY